MPPGGSKSGHQKGVWYFLRHEIHKNYFNIYTMAEACNFKFGTPIWFAKDNHKSHPEEKWAWPWFRGATQNFGVPL